MHIINDVPFNRFLGLEVAGEPTQLLRLPAGGQYLNHLGTVHASAQIALAEASSGAYLLRALGPGVGFVPVVRRFESKFRKPANGALTSTVRALPETLDRLQTDLAGQGAGDGQHSRRASRPVRHAHTLCHGRMVHRPAARSTHKRLTTHSDTLILPAAGSVLAGILLRPLPSPHESS